MYSLPVPRVFPAVSVTVTSSSMAGPLSVTSTVTVPRVALSTVPFTAVPSDRVTVTASPLAQLSDSKSTAM